MIMCSDQLREWAPFRAEIDAAIARVLDAGWFILGEEVAVFEQAFGAYCDDAHVVGVASGTDALQLALMDAGVCPGDEVLTVANTAVPTVSAISSVGAHPVFVDIEPDTYLMDVKQLPARLTPRTKAIIPVHLYGQSVAMDAVIAFARNHGLVVIEDACQAHGAVYKGRKVGTWGDYGCFSFYPTKNLGGMGDGGAVISHDVNRIQRLYQLRNYGQSSRYVHEKKGINSRLDALQAAILQVKLPYLDQENARRQYLAQRYLQGLEALPVIVPATAKDSTHVYHIFALRLKERDALMAYLQNHGIRPLIHYPIPIPAQKAYREYAEQLAFLLHTQAVCGEILSLPLYPQLTETEVDTVCATIRAFFDAKDQR